MAFKSKAQLARHRFHNGTWEGRHITTFRSICETCFFPNRSNFSSSWASGYESILMCIAWRSAVDSCWSHKSLNNTVFYKSRLWLTCFMVLYYERTITAKIPFGRHLLSVCWNLFLEIVNVSCVVIGRWSYVNLQWHSPSKACDAGLHCSVAPSW